MTDETVPTVPVVIAMPYPENPIVLPAPKVSMWSKVKAFFKTITGYTHVLRPLWDRYEAFVGAHPRIAAVVILVLAILSIR